MKSPSPAPFPFLVLASAPAQPDRAPLSANVQQLVGKKGAGERAVGARGWQRGGRSKEGRSGEMAGRQVRYVCVEDPPHSWFLLVCWKWQVHCVGRNNELSGQNFIAMNVCVCGLENRFVFL